MSDPLREAYALQLKALRALRREIAREDRAYRKIMDAVRESDEAAANMGGDAGEHPARNPRVAGTPCSDVHPDYGATTHAFAAIRCSGGVCAEAMDAIEDEA